MKKAVYGVADEFKTFKGMKDLIKIPCIDGKLTDKTKPTELKHTKGTVMLIDFWATWCPPC